MRKNASIRTLILLFVALLSVSLNAQQAKYIFYFIGDGMGMGHVSMSDNYNRIALGNQQPLNMLRMPVQSFQTTYSASSPVTDSAAAGTALATGVKTKNSMLGMSPDTVAVHSIANVLHNNGYGVAIMTNSAADDATPAAFYAHIDNRHRYYEIGRQAAESGYELIAGAALRGLEKDGKSTGLAQYIASHDVELLNSADAVATSDSRRIILTPSTSRWDWDMGYRVDNNEGQMTISDLTTTALNHLLRHTPERFFMMVECGSIDHAAHANDAGAVVKDVIGLDDAISIALEFYQKHPEETLIVITADHDTGGLSVGNNYTGYMAHPQYLLPQKMSKEVFSKYCDKLMDSNETPSWEDMKQYLTENFELFTTIPMSERREKRLKKVFENTFIQKQSRRQETLYSNFNQFAVEVFEMLNDKAGAGWTSLYHNGNMVPIFAIGAGSELFCGQNDNTDIPKKILQATNLQLK